MSIQFNCGNLKSGVISGNSWLNHNSYLSSFWRCFRPFSPQKLVNKQRRGIIILKYHVQHDCYSMKGRIWSLEAWLPWISHKFFSFFLSSWELPFSFSLSQKPSNSWLKREVLFTCYVFIRDVGTSLSSVFMGKESAKHAMCLDEHWDGSFGVFEFRWSRGLSQFSLNLNRHTPQRYPQWSNVLMVLQLSFLASMSP